MKPGLLYQLMTALGGQKAPTPPWGPVFEEPKRPTADQGGPPPAWLKRSRPFTDDQKAAVWAKAQPILGWDPDDWRVDHRGNPLFRSHYGDRGSSFGWEIGHVVDPVRGGSDDMANLRPQRCQQRRETDVRIGTPVELDPFAR